VLGADFVTLSKLLASYQFLFSVIIYLFLLLTNDKYWPDATKRPRIIGPDLNPNTPWLDQFLSVAGPVMDAVTYHLYIGYVFLFIFC
jgi:hypothetical protein